MSTRSGAGTRYYERVAGSRLRVLELGEDDVRADPANRWGEAPFHYTPDVYAAVAAGVDGVLRDMHPTR